MRLYFDESGDYAFPTDRFDCYAQAGLICPDSRLATIEEFVAARKREWGLAELHASELEPAQIAEVAAFIGASDCQLLAQLTDTVMITPERIEQFRLDQAAKLERNLDWYRRESTRVRGEPVAEIEQWMLRQIKRSGLASQIAHGEFVQAQFLVGLINDCLQKSLYFFHEDQWREDFRDFHFIVDAKNLSKLARGERYLDETIVKVLGSRPNESLGILDTWKEDPVHPFVERFSQERGRVAGRDVEGAIDASGIFEHGIEFEDSSTHAGLQLVDTVAHVTRRAVVEPENAEIQDAFDAFRSKLRNDEGRSLTLGRLSAGEEDRSSLDLYLPLYGALRQPPQRPAP